MHQGKILLTAALLVATIALVCNALAETAPPLGECPPGAPSCKVVIMTPQEEQTLTGQNGVFDQAVWASRSTMQTLVDAWKQKLAQSPNGTKAPEPKKPEAKVEPPKK